MFFLKFHFAGKLVLFCSLLIMHNWAMSQVNNQDCLGAIPVCQGIYEQATSYSGTGFVSGEINPAISCLNSGEKNDVWYVLTVQSSGLLYFTITPNAPSDYDWALFNLTNNVCEDIQNIEELEVSCNYDGATQPTGANGNQGQQNEPPVPVIAGETYVLNVSNFSTNQTGYMLDFTVSTAGIYDTQIPALSEVLPIPCFSSELTVRFSEFVLCSSVSLSDFVLIGPSGPIPIISYSATGCQGGGNHDRDYTLVTSSMLLDGSYELQLNGEVEDLCGNASQPSSLEFSIYDNQPVPLEVSSNVPCLGSTLNLESTFYNSASYEWTGPSGFYSTLQSPQLINVSSSASGTYTVAVTLRNDCVFTADINVVVGSAPLPTSKPIKHN